MPYGTKPHFFNIILLSFKTIVKKKSHYSIYENHSSGLFPAHAGMILIMLMNNSGDLEGNYSFR